MSGYAAPNWSRVITCAALGPPALRPAQVLTLVVAKNSACVALGLKERQNSLRGRAAVDQVTEGDDRIPRS